MKKTLLYLAALLTIAWGMSACLSKEGWPGDYLSNLTQHDRNRILNDTITPPNNPMAPGTTDKDYYTIRGVLVGEMLSVQMGYHPCITVNDTVQREKRGYFLFKGNEPIRFNSPDLAGRKIGDTLYVTGEVTYRAGDFYTLEYVAIQ